MTDGHVSAQVATGTSLMQPARVRHREGPTEAAIIPLARNGKENSLHLPGKGQTGSLTWSPRAAEATLRTLMGVISARVVLNEAGELREIHLLTDTKVPPKKTVRRVESAFVKHWGMKIDHRKVSVAQSRWPVGGKGQTATSSAPFHREPISLVVDRPSHGPLELQSQLRFEGHEIELEPSGLMRVRVHLEAEGERFTGEARGSQRARSRMAILAEATLEALKASLEGAEASAERPSAYVTLENIDVIDAFKKDFVLASVNWIGNDGVSNSAGAAPVEGSLDRAVIRSTLQAADPWVHQQR